jgi:hypothetical protein
MALEHDKFSDWKYYTQITTTINNFFHYFRKAGSVLHKLWIAHQYNTLKKLLLQLKYKVPWRKVISKSCANNDKQDQQGKVAFNECNPHTQPPHDPAIRSLGS